MPTVERYNSQANIPNTAGVAEAPMSLAQQPDTYSGIGNLGKSIEQQGNKWADLQLELKRRKANFTDAISTAKAKLAYKSAREQAQIEIQVTPDTSKWQAIYDKYEQKAQKEFNKLEFTDNQRQMVIADLSGESETFKYGLELSEIKHKQQEAEALQGQLLLDSYANYGGGTGDNKDQYRPEVLKVRNEYAKILADTYSPEMLELKMKELEKEGEKMYHENVVKHFKDVASTYPDETIEAISEEIKIRQNGKVKNFIELDNTQLQSIKQYAVGLISSKDAEQKEAIQNAVNRASGDFGNRLSAYSTGQGDKLTMEYIDSYDFGIQNAEEEVEKVKEVWRGRLQSRFDEINKEVKIDQNEMVKARLDREALSVWTGDTTINDFYKIADEARYGIIENGKRVYKYKDIISNTPLLDNGGYANITATANSKLSSRHASEITTRANDAGDAILDKVQPGMFSLILTGTDIKDMDLSDDEKDNVRVLLGLVNDYRDNITQWLEEHPDASKRDFIEYSKITLVDYNNDAIKKGREVIAKNKELAIKNKPVDKSKPNTAAIIKARQKVGDDKEKIKEYLRSEGYDI